MGKWGGREGGGGGAAVGGARGGRRGDVKVERGKAGARMGVEEVFGTHLLACIHVLYLDSGTVRANLL